MADSRPLLEISSVGVVFRGACIAIERRVAQEAKINSETGYKVGHEVGRIAGYA